MAFEWMNNGLSGNDEGSTESERPDWLDDDDYDITAEGETTTQENDGDADSGSNSKESNSVVDEGQALTDDDDDDWGSLSFAEDNTLATPEPDDPDALGGSVRGNGMSPVVSPGSGSSSAVGASSGSDGASGEDLLSYEDRARIHADSLISTALSPSEHVAELRKKMYSTAIPELFSDENYLIYKVMYKFRSANFTLDAEFLETYLTVNLGEVEKSGGKIDLTKYGEVDGSSALGYIAGVMGHYEELRQKEPLTSEEFDRAYETYLLYYQQIEGLRVYNDSVAILQDGLKSRDTKGFKAGFEDSAHFARRGLADVEGRLDRNEGTGFVSMRDSILNDEDSRVEVKKLAEYGDIDELNKHYGGLYSGSLVTIVGPPKAGKSKLCARVVYSSITTFGQNVTVWPIEGGTKMYEAQMRAIHFHEMYNGSIARGEKSREEGIWGVSQGAILKKTLANISDKVNVEELERASAMDLVTNPEYGSIDMIDRPFNVDTFLDEIELSVASNGSSIVLIDYMQLISAGEKQNTREAIADAYPKLLDFAKKQNLLIISPAQYSQTAVNELSKSKGKDMDMRTSIGESSAIMRSSDLVIAMYASAEDIRNNNVSFLSVPARLDQPFEAFSAYADLGSCTYMSYKEGTD